MKRQLHSNWREDLREVVDIPPSEPKTDKSERRIEDKKVNNKIVINPQMTEAFEEIGATILEVTELDEKSGKVEESDDISIQMRILDMKRKMLRGQRGEKRKAAMQAQSDRVDQMQNDIEEGLFGKKKPLGPTKARYGGSKEPTTDTRYQVSKADIKAKTPAAQNLAKGDKRYKMVGEDISSTQVQERTLSSDEKEEKERIVKGMKKSKGGFEKRYGDDAKSVMYATATKLAKEETQSDKHKEAIRIALAKTMPGQKPLNKKDIAQRRQDTKKKEKESGVRPKIKPFPMSSRFD